MTQAYDMERLCIALDRTKEAAGDMYAHDPPDWLCHRLTHIIGECQSLREVLAQHAKEEGGADADKS